MSLFDNMFRGRKQEKLEQLAQQFDKIKDEYTKVFVNRLGDPDTTERQGCANLLRDKVLPVLADDKNQKSRELSTQTIKRLIKELRPPSSAEELNDLENAMFYFARRKLRERAK